MENIKWDIKEIIDKAGDACDKKYPTGYNLTQIREEYKKLYFEEKKDKVCLLISPTSEEEANAYGNALAESGDYPAGLTGCFVVGISGGCGQSCYVYQDGKCEHE